MQRPCCSRPRSATARPIKKKQTATLFRLAVGQSRIESDHGKTSASAEITAAGARPRPSILRSA